MGESCAGSSALPAPGRRQLVAGCHFAAAKAMAGKSVLRDYHQGCGCLSLPSDLFYPYLSA